jgi:hypothetical protein
MNRVLRLVLASGLASAVVGGVAFASPTYTMNASMSAGMTTLFSDFITGAYTIILAAIAVVGGYFVSIRLIHLFMGWIHKFGA